jgi:hypothetical protein
MLSLVIADPTYCGDGWSYDLSSGSCFKGYNEVRTFDEAHQLCLGLGDGSDLASVTSLETQNYINGMYAVD